jgi:hypothetical protein
MGKTQRREAFHRLFGEAATPCPTRRAKEHREALQQVMDFVIYGDDVQSHPFSNEYESGDVTMVRNHG